MSLYSVSPCRDCGEGLETILDLGTPYLSDFLPPDQTAQVRAPLDLCVCDACRLVQLRHTVSPDSLFRKYWYLSGVNETMREELASVVDHVRTRVRLEPLDYVLDIGANDGTLLSAYPTSLTRIAFEPALNLNDQLHQHAFAVVPDYFPRGLKELERLDGQVKAITAIACFYACQDPHAFLAAVKRILHPAGVFVVQFQDWDGMQKATAFDNICSEHLFYPTLASMERMLAPHGLEVVDAEVRSINGGSYRLTICHRGFAHASARVDTLRQQEAGCEEWDTFEHFAWAAQTARRQIRGLLRQARDQGQIIDAYGASTKGNTLLQWCGIDQRLIRQAWERSPAKVGLQTPGSDIPIVDEVMGRLFEPDLLFVLIWQFREAVLRREQSFLDGGGVIVFPLPQVDIVRGLQ